MTNYPVQFLVGVGWCGYGTASGDMQYPFWEVCIVLLKYLLTIAAKIRQQIENKGDIWSNNSESVHEHQLKAEHGGHHHTYSLSPFLRFFLLFLVFISYYEGSLAILRRWHGLRDLGQPPRQHRWMQHWWGITPHCGGNAISPRFWLRVSAWFAFISVSHKIKV